MTERDRIAYAVGNEHNPGNPFGRQHLVIELDGRARLDHYTLGPHFAWTGTVRASVLDRFWNALAQSDFPAFPKHPFPAGSTTRSLSVGNGLAARSTFAAYHAREPGYSTLFPILDSIIRQLSEDKVPVIPAIDERLVDDVQATDTDEPRELTAGMVYLLAYLPGFAIAREAQEDLLARLSGDAELGRAVEAARGKLARDAQKTTLAANRIAAMARLGEIELGKEAPQWRAIAEAVRPHLTTPLLNAAWSAGEAARLVTVSVALLAQLAFLRAAAPANDELRVLAEARAQALTEHARALAEHLRATGLRLVISHAESVQKMVGLTRRYHLEATSGIHDTLIELDRDLNSFMDAHSTRLDERPPPEADSQPSAEEQALLARILETPWDFAPRVEFAKLGERRNDPRARAILLRLAGDDRSRHEAYELVRAHPEWAAPLEALGASDIKFELGFPDLITIDADVLLARHAEIFAAAPVRRLKVRNANGRVAELVCSPLLANMAGLDLDDQGVTDDDVVALARSPHAARLVELALRYNPISARGIEAIAASPHLKALELVALDGNPDDPCDRQQYYNETQYDFVPTEKGRALEATYGPLKWLHPNQ